MKRVILGVFASLLVLCSVGADRPEANLQLEIKLVNSSGDGVPGITVVISSL